MAAVYQMTQTRIKIGFEIEHTKHLALTLGKRRTPTAMHQ